MGDSYYCLESDGPEPDKTTPERCLTALHIKCYRAIKALERYATDLDLLRMLDPVLAKKISNRHRPHPKSVTLSLREVLKAIGQELEARKGKA